MLGPSLWFADLTEPTASTCAPVAFGKQLGCNPAALDPSWGLAFSHPANIGDVSRKPIICCKLRMTPTPHRSIGTTSLQTKGAKEGRGRGGRWKGGGRGGEEGLVLLPSRSYELTLRCEGRLLILYSHAPSTCVLIGLSELGLRVAVSTRSKRGIVHLFVTSMKSDITCSAHKLIPSMTHPDPVPLATQFGGTAHNVVWRVLIPPACSATARRPCRTCYRYPLVPRVRIAGT